MEYKIRKPAGTCAGCGQEIPIGESMYSTLLLEATEPARRDHCVPCFTGVDTKAGDDFAFWRTKRAGAEQVRRVIDFVTLRSLFFKMASRPGEEYRKIAYLVALLLLRKKFLQLREFVTEGGRDFVVVVSKDRPEPLKLEAPALRAEEFAEMREKLSVLLDVDIDEEGDGAALQSAVADAEDATDVS